MWLAVLVWLAAAFADGYLAQVVLLGLGIILAMWAAVTFHIGVFTAFGLLMFLIYLDYCRTRLEENKKTGGEDDPFDILGYVILIVLLLMVCDLIMLLIR